MVKDLTIKQKRFADLYIQTGNATQSYIKAGYAPKTARYAACETLAKPHVRRYIEERLQQLDNKSLLSVEEALAITASIARGESQVSVKGIKTPEGDQVVEVIDPPTFSDRQKALEHFYRLNGMFLDKQEVALDADVNIKARAEKYMRYLKGEPTE